jgi:hypothetical protein
MVMTATGGPLGARCPVAHFGKLAGGLTFLKERRGCDPIASRSLIGGLRNGSGRPSRPLAAPKSYGRQRASYCGRHRAEEIFRRNVSVQKRGGRREGDRRFSRGPAIGWWTMPSPPPPPLLKRVGARSESPMGRGDAEQRRFS